MVSFRPPPTKSGQWLRLGLTALVALHVVMSAWIVVQFEGVYTEGAPAPSEIHALIAIDKEQTLIDVKIERATSLFFYAIQRDDTASINANNTADDDDSNEDSSTGSSGNLDFSRKATLGLLFIFVLCEVAILLRNHNLLWLLRSFIWLTLMAFFVLIIPMSYVMDLGGIENANFGDDRKSDAMVHVEESSDITMVPLGLMLEYDTAGYDLGLIALENRSKVIENEPIAGSVDARSWIAFESEFSIAMGNNLHTLVFFPIVWFFIPTFPSDSEDETKDTTKEFVFNSNESE